MLLEEGRLKRRHGAWLSLSFLLGACSWRVWYEQAGPFSVMNIFIHGPIFACLNIMVVGDISTAVKPHRLWGDNGFQIRRIDP